MPIDLQARLPMLGQEQLAAISDQNFWDKTFQTFLEGRSRTQPPHINDVYAAAAAADAALLLRRTAANIRLDPVVEPVKAEGESRAQG